MRLNCANCLRPKVTCICHFKSKVETTIEVFIIQHPLEVLETKGTARLLHLCLPNSSLTTGEVLEAEFIENFLTSSKNSILLYPTTPEDHSLGIAPPTALDPEVLKDLNKLRLIVIDGTWRKSRKILIKNPYLQTLPRLVLNDLPIGQYIIRKARKSHQLSTLEATCAALAQLERNSEKYKPLNDAFLAFNAMITLQMKY